MGLQPTGYCWEPFFFGILMDTVQQSGKRCLNCPLLGISLICAPAYLQISNTSLPLQSTDFVNFMAACCLKTINFGKMQPTVCRQGRSQVSGSCMRPGKQWYHRQTCAAIGICMRAWFRSHAATWPYPQEVSVYTAVSIFYQCRDFVS